MHTMASAYPESRRDETLKMREELLTLSRRVNGPQHPRTRAAINNLVVSYDDAGRKDEAEALRKELAGKEITPTPTPVPVPGTPKPAPAAADIKTLEAALALARKEHGPDHPDTITAMTSLASVYGADGSGRKAIKLGKEALALARRVLPAGDPHTIQAMKVLIPLYKSVDLTDDAAKLEAEIVKLSGKK